MSNHFSAAYLLSNICTKNYWNRTTVVEIIVGSWVICIFLGHSVLCAVELEACEAAIHDRTSYKRSS